jgi:nanoRNase/pAp phosphatase (c-di-AMP/oligoRNAs hydrolase)
VLTPHEYKTAERLRADYWLYVVFDCATQPRLISIQDPIRLGWEPIVRIEHYQIGAEAIQKEAGQ